MVNIILQEKAILESIENDSETLFNELQSLELDSLQPWYVRNNESYPEIDVLKRIVIALNQADIAMKGNHWNKEENKPDDVLNAFLKKKAASVRERIKEGTGLDIEPICYCAGYSEEGEEQCKPYNLTKLLHTIIQIIPREKRLALVDNLNTNKENWMHDDEEEDYGEETEYDIIDTIFDFIEGGSELGGKILGIPGKLVGGVAGAVVGTVAGIFKSIFG